MARYFIYLGYDGTNYHGWQIQPNGASVQEELQKALSTLMRRPMEVVGAGRTDAGVHASLMIAHTDIDASVDASILVDKLNRLLPPDIAVYRIRRVTDEAHARFDATYRKYQYHITKLHTDVKTNNCRIMHARWEQTGADEWVFTIQADRFLRNMVRAVVGTLVEVGRGKLSIEGFRRVIEAKDRCSAGTSVPGHALFLVDVGYPDHLFLDMEENTKACEQNGEHECLD